MEFLALPLPEMIVSLEAQYRWEDALRCLRMASKRPGRRAQKASGVRDLPNREIAKVVCSR